jgi:hypothetical protein
MGILMIDEFRDVYVFLSIDLVPDNKFSRRFFELFEQIIKITIVVWQDDGLQAARSIFQPARLIGVAPESSECEPGERPAIRKVFVEEESGFQVSSPRHRKTLILRC